MFSRNRPSLLQRLSGSSSEDTSPRPGFTRRESWTSFQGSTAQETVISRWPSIVSGMILELEDLDAEPGSSQRVEARAAAEKSTIIEKLRRIRSEIECNGDLTPLKRDSAGDDVEHINRRLAVYKRQLKWRDSPYLLTECYLYRRVQTIFDRSKYWKGFDVFGRQKDEALIASGRAIEELAAHVEHGNTQLGLPDARSPSQQRELFNAMTQIALWADAVEIPSVELLKQGAIQPLAGLASIHARPENVVDDDSEAVWTYLSNPSRQNRRIDIVLGNAGFGLFADIVYAAYLLQSNLASMIVFHLKDIPWYVDNPTTKDFQRTILQLGQANLFPSRQYLEPLLKRIQSYLSAGTMVLRSHSFWTTAFAFPEMARQAPALFKGFRASSLVIFKGDYNYRKLTSGLQWPHTTPFSEAIGELGAVSGLRILSLRTNKADVCVGVKSEDIDRLDEETVNREWVRNGKYAVISFSDGGLDDRGERAWERAQSVS